MKLKLSVFIIAAVLLAACSKIDNTETDEKIWSITGYYLRTNNDNMLIAEHSYSAQDGSTETYYEPMIIYFEGEEHGDIPIDSLKTGDKIEVDVKSIMESYPAFAPIYGLRFIEDGDISAIDPNVISKLDELGYTVV